MEKIYLSVMTFNPKGHSDNFGEWHKVVNWINSQKGVDIDLCIVDNSNNVRCREVIENELGAIRPLRCLFIKDKISVNAAWNFGISKLARGEYDWYGFECSDVYPQRDIDILTLVEDARKVDNCLVISGQATCDMSLAWSELLGFEDKDPTKVDLGKGHNGHLTLFEKRFVDVYGGRVDVLYAGRTEPFIPFQCEAIGGVEAVSHRVMLTHSRINDPYRGMEREEFSITDNPVQMTYEEFSRVLDEGVECGIGWEEHCKDWPHRKMHDPNKFNAEKLRDFIKDKLYLKSSFFEKLEYDVYDSSSKT